MKPCKKHPAYKAIHPPRRTKNNPEGCPTCWEFYRDRKHAAELELAGKTKPKQHTPLTRGNIIRAMDGKKKLDAKRMKLKKDDLSGQWEVFYGTRCLFTAAEIGDVDSFLVGFKEGLNFDGTIQSYSHED